MIMGVPIDLGAGRRGVDMGTSAIRYAGLNERLQRLEWDVEDFGNIEVPIPETREIKAVRGITYWEAHLAMEILGDYGRVSCKYTFFANNIAQ
jgi:arginase family enzyme